MQRSEQRRHGRSGHEGVPSPLVRVDVVHRTEPFRRSEQRQRGTHAGQRPGPPTRRRDRRQRRPHLVGQPPQCRGLGTEGHGLFGVRQFAVDQEMPDVLEAAGLREFDSRVLTVVGLDSRPVIFLQVRATM